MNKELEEAKVLWHDLTNEDTWESLSSDEKFELWWEVFDNKTNFVDPSPDFKEVAKIAWDTALEEYMP